MLWCQRICAALNTHLVTAWTTWRGQVCFAGGKTNLTEVNAFKLIDHQFTDKEKKADPPFTGCRDTLCKYRYIDKL